MSRPDPIIFYKPDQDPTLFQKSGSGSDIISKSGSDEISRTGSATMLCKTKKYIILPLVSCCPVWHVLH